MNRPALRRGWLGVLVATALAGCATAPSAAPAIQPRVCGSPSAIQPATPGPHATRNLVLIAIDGTRWQEIFLGVDPQRGRDAGIAVQSAPELLPNLYHLLIARGVALGAPGYGPAMTASGPEFVSLPGYKELLSGRPALECTSNRCPPARLPTLLDGARHELAASADDVAAIASWERLDRATAQDNGAILISVGRTQGATRERLRLDACTSALLDEAARASPAPGNRDYRPDRYTAALALSYLRQRQPRVLFVGLGDPDEYGHAGDYRGFVGALQKLDAFLGDLYTELGALGRYGQETTVIVTTDHGWSSEFTDHGSFAPESARVWLIAQGGAVPQRGLVEARRAHHLADVAPTARQLLGLAPDGDPRAGGPIEELLPASKLAALRAASPSASP